MPTLRTDVIPKGVLITVAVLLRLPTLERLDGSNRQKSYLDIYSSFDILAHTSFLARKFSVEIIYTVPFLRLQNVFY